MDAGFVWFPLIIGIGVAVAWLVGATSCIS
jgi:hypothetical protein